MSLPTNLLPGKDLISKRIIQDPKIVNYITEALTGTTDGYFVGNCEWRNRTRSDVVLEPKSSVDLRPIIIEVQSNVNNEFLKRAVGYCLQASSRFDVDPIMLIICVEKLNQEIKDDVVDSRLPGIYSYFCKPWAAECLIICQESLAQTLTIPLDPLVAIGLFLTNRSMSIIDRPYGSDPTIQYLHILALHFHQIDFQDITYLPLKLINSQIAEYDKLITLANTLNQPQLVEAVKESKSRIYGTKRKYDDCLNAEVSFNSTVSNNNENDDLLAEASEDQNAVNTREDYEAAMKFVAEFKQKRTEIGKRMDWNGCLKEGKNILKYKNADSLRIQFHKYCKEKNKN